MDLNDPANRGVAGGVVVQDAFKQHFLADENGNISSSAQANVNGNVVSVLQAGAFFGALGGGGNSKTAKAKPSPPSR